MGMNRNDLYSEAQMAKACCMKQDKFVRLLELSEWGFRYHTHKRQTDNGEYLFNDAAYDINVAIAACVRLGGHDFEPCPRPAQYEAGDFVKCKRCGHKRLKPGDAPEHLHEYRKPEFNRKRHR